MKVNEFITEEVAIDNQSGLGAVPNNQEVDYRGLRTLMKPSTFLNLAAPIGEPVSVEHLSQHIKSGGALGAPFLHIAMPEEWEDGDFTTPARVVGHEGRNRMLAIQEVFGNNPLEVHLFFTNDTRRRHITDDMINQLNVKLISEKGSSRFVGPYFKLI